MAEKYLCSSSHVRTSKFQLAADQPSTGECCCCCCCCYVTSVVSDSMRPHRWQPNRLPRPWDSPGKNTGVSCHFLLQCIKVKVKSLSRIWLVATPWTTVHGIFQAAVLEWGAIAFRNYRQENAGSQQIKIPHIQEQRRRPSNMVGVAESCLESNLIPTRDAQRVQKHLVCTRTQGNEQWPPQEPEPHLPLSVWVSLQRHRSAVACRGDRGSGCSRPERHSVQHKFSQRRSPLAPPESSQADDPQTGEQLYQRCSRTAAKVLRPTIDFPTWRSDEILRTCRGLEYRNSIGLGKQTLGGHSKTLCAPEPKRKEQWPHKRLSQTCLSMFWSLWRRRGWTVACCGVRGTDSNSPGNRAVLA